MGLATLYEALGAADGSAVEITEIWVGAWGRDIVLEGICDDVRFELAFDDCREMRWRVYAHDNNGEPTALVDFAPGRDEHRSPAQILTDTCALTLWYGALIVQRLS